VPNQKLRVGSVPYLVGRPVDEGLAREPGIEFSRAVPAHLARGLLDGSLDVGLVSSIELFRLPGASYLDGPCIAGEGRVSSVQVFLRRPPSEVRRLASDPASRTTVVLAQIVWPGPRPELVEVPEGTDPRSVEADAWVRIGDAALREHLAPGSPPVFNPSEAWRARTGLPFVFALWVARAGIDLEPWLPAFLRSRALGAARLAELAEEAAAAWRVSPAATRRYLFEECLFDAGDRLEPSLFAFRDAAAALALAPGHVRPARIPSRSAAPARSIGAALQPGSPG
jgi:chorismate dehydratase